MKAKRLGVVNRRAVILLALALLAATLVLTISNFRSEPLKEFLVASRDLASGSLITEADFDRVALDLPNQKLYLSTIVPQAALASPLRRGELLPVSALGSPDSRYSVVIKPSQPIASSIRVGSLVDVWFVAKSNSPGSAAVPQRVATSLEVRSIVQTEASSSFGAEPVQLEIAASADDLAALMLASAEGGFIGVVSNR